MTLGVCLSAPVARVAHFKAAGSKEGLVDHVATIGHADDEDVVQLVDTVEFCEKLVNHRVVDTGSGSLDEEKTNSTASETPKIHRSKLMTAGCYLSD